MSFDLKPSIDRGLVGADRILLASPRFRGREVDLLGRHSPDGGLVDPSDCLVFPVHVPDDVNASGETGEEDCTRIPLASIQSPDLCDYKASPFSFVVPMALNLGDGCCESLVPASLPVQEHAFFEIVVRREAIGNQPDLNDGAVREVDVTAELKTKQPPKLRFAEVLKFKQQWHSLGHSLGEIKYSLALAPGEATEMAIIDWSRQDTASRTDAVSATEYLDNSLKVDRSIDETISAALKESQGGSSFMAGTAGQASGNTYGTGMWTGNHAVGGGVSNSWGNRNLESDALQTLHDSIRQQTGYTRSLNSTVVVQASQAEQNVLQTRRVANHNHCHALTIEYYEVLRHFMIRTEFSGRQKALLVPFAPFVFTWQLALKLQSILEPVLLDASLKGCFDAIYRHEVVPAIYDKKPEAPTPQTGDTTPTTTSKVVNLDTSLGEGVASGLSVKPNDNIRITASGEATLVYNTGSHSSNPNGDPGSADNSFLAPGLKPFSLIYKIGDAGAWKQAGTSLTATPADATGEIVLGVNDQKGTLGNNQGTWVVTVEVPSPKTIPPPLDPTPAVADPITREGDELCMEKLLRHLNGNQFHYNSSVWVLQSAVERRLRLESALAAHPDLLDALDDVPIAVSGNHVAFAYDGPISGWHDKRDDDPDTPLEDIVTLPTRGVFAEAQLSHCNACEQRDITRMWDWTQMTTEEPPAISGIAPGPKGALPSLTAAQLPQNVVQIMQPPAEPDPAGLAAALAVLGKPGIFRDMSGMTEVSSLLGTLVKAAAGGGATATTQGKTPTEKLDNLQVAKEIAKSGSQLGLTKDETTATVEKTLADDGGGQGPGATESPTGALTTRKAWPNLDSTTVLARIEALSKDANLFNQGSIGLCTAAAFFHHIIQRDPSAFKAFGTALYGAGIGFLGSLKVNPGSDLRNADYAALSAKFFGMPPQADWMLMSALRDSENWFFDFEGAPDESIAMETSAKEMSGWYEDTAFYNAVSYETDTSLAGIKAINKTAHNQIALWIKEALIQPGNGTHMITVEGPIAIDEAKDTVSLAYWTWGHPVQPMNTTLTSFKANYLGAITAAF